MNNLKITFQLESMGLKRQRGLIVAIDTYEKKDYEKLKTTLPSIAELDKNIVLMPGVLPMLRFHSDFTGFLKQYDNKTVFNAKVAEDSQEKSNKMLNICKEHNWDGIIVHGCIPEKVMRNLVENSEDTDIIAVTRMSSKTLAYEKYWGEISLRSIECGVSGLVVGTNHPNSIRMIREMIDERDNSIYICSPGIGIQGGNMDTALKAGTDYPIIGRAILKADNPVEETIKYLNKLSSYS